MWGKSGFWICFVNCRYVFVIYSISMIYCIICRIHVCKRFRWNTIVRQYGFSFTLIKLKSIQRRNWIKAWKQIVIEFKLDFGFFFILTNDFHSINSSLFMFNHFNIIHLKLVKQLLLLKRNVFCQSWFAIR